MKIFMDYGHGGNDPGAVGNGLKEKDLTLSIGKKIATILKNHNVKVVESRTTDKAMSLKERTDLANKEKADILVSIHINSFKDSKANGVETFSFPNSRFGSKLSKTIQDELVKAKLFKVDRVTKTANFHMLRESNMPSALTELGFISNAEDSKVMINKQNEIAIAVAKGILNYLGIKYKEEAREPVKGNVKGYYRVIAGSYQDKANAEKQMDKLKKLGIEGVFLAYYE